MMITVTAFRRKEEAEKMATKEEAKAPKARTLQRVQTRHPTTNQFASGSTIRSWDASQSRVDMLMFVRSASARLTQPSNVLARTKDQTHLAKSLD